LFDYAPLTVDISIIKEFVLDKQYMIIKNSKDLLELIVQEFENKSDVIWYKHLRYVNITKHSKAW